MGQRDACIGCSSNRGSDSRHDFKGDTGFYQHLGFFAAAAEYKRVSAFKAGNNPPGFCLIHQQAVDLILGKGMVAAFFAHIDQFGRFASMF